MQGVLLLNASYEPLRVIALKRAVVLILQEKAEIVEAGEEPVRSAYLTLNLPKVIRLKYFVKIPYRAKAALNRKALMARDEGICQYCFGPGNTIDHVLPRSRGGTHEWSNVVLACAPCNQKKSDKLLSELGWKLAMKPEVPRASSRILIGVVKMDEEWAEYLAYDKEPHLRLA